MVRFGSIVITAFIALVLSGSNAQAGTIFSSVYAGDYTSYTLSGLTHSWDTSQPWSGDVVSSSTVGSQTASATNGGTYKGATTSSSGSANLSTGQIRGFQSAILAPGALATNAVALVYSGFGDSFQVFGPSGPFSWTPANQVQFTLAVTGHIDPGSVGSFNLVFAYGAPGALANNGRSVGGNFPAGQVQGGFVEIDGCNFGVGFSEPDVRMTCGSTLTMNAAGDVSGTVSAQFAPNGNFDWIVWMFLQGNPGTFGSSGPGSSSMNFSNTVTVGYSGPPATTTSSASGVFPGTFPAALTAAIDIKPGDFPNSINPTNQGAISVAILTTPTFDAVTVNPLTVQFGPNAAAPIQWALEDVNGDSKLDMILHFRTQDAGIVCGNTSAILKGNTFGGQAIVGSDSINTVGCK
jgi:hypothetical protein